MKGIHISTNEFSTESKSKLVSILTSILLVIVVVLFVPFILLFILFHLIKDLFSKKESNELIKNDWVILKTNSELSLKTKFIDLDRIPDFIIEFFDPKPIRIFESIPSIAELDGYFSDFKVERSDGVFLQKIEVDMNQEKVISANLIFLNYSTLKIEYIKDLLGCEIMTKGRPNDFIITAFDDEQEHEIHLIQD